MQYSADAGGPSGVRPNAVGLQRLPFKSEREGVLPTGSRVTIDFDLAMVRLSTLSRKVGRPEADK